MLDSELLENTSETYRKSPVDLSILVLTHNDSRFLGGCLRSIQERVLCPYEVILVDNGSTDGDPEQFLGGYPWVRLIRSDRNLGFNAGNNLAAKGARGKFILLLNVDTVLLSDVAPAVRLLQANLGVGVVGAQSYGSSREVRPSAGRFPRAWRLWMFRNLWARPKRIYGPSEYRAFKVDWVEGSFLMTTAENWATLGGVDERNPLFGNDVDFCRATVGRGLAVVQCTGVKYVHFGGYVVSRTSLLYAGLRGYHRRFSSSFERVVADVVLRVGLFARILVYGLWYGVTRNGVTEEKWRRFVEVHRSWAQMAPRT